MNEIEKREKRGSIVGLMIGEQSKEEKESIEVEPKTFYITPEQSKQLALEKAHTGKDLSTIVREAITDYFNKVEVNK